MACPLACILWHGLDVKTYCSIWPDNWNKPARGPIGNQLSLHNLNQRNHADGPPAVLAAGMFQLAIEGREINLSPSDRSENLTAVKINEFGNATGSDKEQRPQSDALEKCTKTRIS